MALLVIAGFSALAILATWPLATELDRVLPGNLGDPLLSAWIIGWDADRLRHGFHDLWNAPILFPSRLTLAFAEHLLGIAVPLAPLVWLTRNPVLVHNVAFLLSYVLAGFGMFLLARLLTGRTTAAVLAGLLYAFGPQRADQISHLQVLMSGWMPITLWALHKYFASALEPRETNARPPVRPLVVFAAAFAIQALSNGYFLYFLALPVIVVTVFACVTEREILKQRARTVFLPLALACAGILLAIAPAAIAYLEVRRLYGFSRSYGDLVNFSADVASYFHVTWSAGLWSGWLAREVAPERQLFPGLAALILAGIALWLHRGRPTAEKRFVTCYAVIGLLAFVLSLGPEPRAWGHRVLPFSPYMWLTAVVPGFDGLRAPARFSAVVFLALSVLAAFGAARLMSVTSRPTARLAAAALALFAIAEGWAAPIPLASFDAHGRPADRPLYEWLARSPQGGVLELPIRAWDITPTLTYQYATLFHGHPIVNGYSGYGSALQELLGGEGSPLNDLSRINDTLEMLRAAGVRYVIVHPADYQDAGFGTRTAIAIRGAPAHVAEAHNFDNAVAFQLLENASRAAPGVDGSMDARIPPTRFRASASDGADRLNLALDGDRDTRWLTGRAQTGNEWIQIQFDRPVDVSAIRLQLARRSYGDYPRELSIESIGAAGEKMTLYRGPVLVQYVRGLLADGAYPWIDVPLPPNHSAAIQLNQVGRVRTWFWSVHELDVRERAVKPPVARTG